MSDMAAEKLKASGWTIVETTGFLSLVGPLWQRIVNGSYEYALVAQDKHHNRNGLVQGGLLMTFADSAKIGEILLSKPRVVRNTRSLIFLTTEVTADNRCIAMANGVFKVLKSA